MPSGIVSTSVGAVARSELQTHPLPRSSLSRDTSGPETVYQLPSDHPQLHTWERRQVNRRETFPRGAMLCFETGPNAPNADANVSAWRLLVTDLGRFRAPRYAAEDANAALAK
jgi:hypothetical protein